MFHNEQTVENPLTEVWLTGTRYFPVPSKILLEPNQNPETDVELEQEQFLLDFSSKLWCSYRRGFESIGSTRLTSDSGWGCMLRSGQMLLANALLRHFLGPAWRLEDLKKNPETLKKYITIVSWFLDRQGVASPYSLSNMATKGVKFDTPIGQWHGPTTTAYILRILVNQHSPGGIKAYVSQDATIYKSEVAKLCEKVPGSNEWHPVVILLPVRIGIELNHSYLPFLAETFRFPQSLGFAGGKMGSSITSVLTFGKLRTQRATRSMYFLGVDDQSGVYYLDPHKTQDAVHGGHDFKEEDFASYHYKNEPKKTTLTQIDPSLLLGFYCRGKAEFENLCERSERLSEERKPPVYVIGKKKPVYRDSVSILTEETDASMKWKETEDWSPFKGTPTTNIGNPRPEMTHYDMSELAFFHSANGDVLGVIVLTQGYLVFEPVRQDPLVRKNGADKYRWWIRIPFLESCKVMTDSTDIEDRNSDDFIVLHSQVEDENQAELMKSASVAESFASNEEKDGIQSLISNMSSISSTSNVSMFSDSQEDADDQTSSPRGSGSNSTISKILHGVDFKLMLVDEFKSAVNWCHFLVLKHGKTISRPTPEVLRLISALEWIFYNGLKERSNFAHLSSQIFDLAKGKVSTTQPLTFWPAIEKLLCAEHLEYLTKPPFHESEMERCRAFLRLALNESVIMNYFQALVNDPKHLQNYYGPKAIFVDPSHCEVLKTLFFSLQNMSFQLPLAGFDLLPEEEDNEEVDEDLPKDNIDIPTLGNPSQIRLTVRNGHVVECFDLEASTDRAIRICGPIAKAMERFKVPLAK